MWGTALLQSWCSAQATIALSSAQAELYAMTKCAQQAMAITSLGADLCIKFNVITYSDATAALAIVYRSGLRGKTRHVKVNYLWLQGAVQRQELNIRKV